MHFFVSWIFDKAQQVDDEEGVEGKDREIREVFSIQPGDMKHAVVRGKVCFSKKKLQKRSEKLKKT